MLRDYGISPEQPGAILLLSDNQGASEGIPPAVVAVSPQGIGMQQPATMADWFFGSTQS
jgi:hypothetical protein